MSIEVLEQLVELTAAPPATSDPDELLAAFSAMFDARAELILTLVRPIPDTEEARALVAELAARDAVWEAALVASRDALGASRRNTNKLRIYAR